MSRPLAVCAGETTMDLIRVGRNDAGGPVYEGHIGGAPVNVSAGLVFHGLAAELWSAVGRDPAGSFATAQLARLGIGAASVSVDGAHPTRLAFIEPLPGGERSTRPAPGASADQFLSADPLPESLARCTLFYFSGAALLGDATARAVLTALHRLQNRSDVLVAFDPNIRLGRSSRSGVVRARMMDVLDLVDVLQVAGDRAADYFDIDLDRLVGRVKLLIATHGDGGADLRTSERSIHVPAVSVPAGDTTGAGDAFLAAILARLVQEDAGDPSTMARETLEEWGRFAAHAAAMIVQKTGGTAAYLSTEGVRPSSPFGPASGSPD